MKKLLSLLLALVATTTLWAYDFLSGELYYTITSSSEPYTVEVTYQEYLNPANYSSLTTATIPASVIYNGITYSVTSIGNLAFSACSSLTSVTIPNSVTNIGDDAFLGCSSLTSVTIPNSVTSIGNSAFSSCSGLTSITIPNSVTSIGERAFYGCSALKSITIPESVTSIGYGAFQGCSALTSITIPNSVTSIGDWAFYECISLTSVTIPSSVTSIGSLAFGGCISLSSITIPDGVTSIRELVFVGCNSLPIENNLRYADKYLVGAVDKTLSTYSIKEGTKWIGDQAFVGCSAFTSITIPNSVTNIEYSAFYGCSSIDTVYIKATQPPLLGGNSFYNVSPFICYIPLGTLEDYKASDWAKYVSQFVEIEYPVDPTWQITYTSSDGNIIMPYRTYVFGANLISNKYSDGQGILTFDGPVRSIGEYAFYGCSSLTSITIPESVTSIGEHAFAFCSSLDSITIPNNVTSIGKYAFSYCSSLNSIIIPSSVAVIEKEAFYNCSSLISLKINATTPPDLGDDAFRLCSRLSAIYIPDNTLSAYQQAWGNEYAFVNNETSLRIHVEVPGTLDDLIFDAGIRPALVAKLTLTGTLSDDDFTSMHDMNFLVEVDMSGITNTTGVNFQEKKNLIKIILPTNLKSIEENAFSLCSSLTSVTMGNSITSIGRNAFNICSSLTSITIPDSVTSIGDRAFYGCNITSITIPYSVTNIGEKAFGSCYELASIAVESGNTIYDSRDNCNAIIETASNTLIVGSKSSIIPNDVKTIGNNAFEGRSRLTSIIIPNSVTNIGNHAFSFCPDLDSVIIGNSVTSIGNSAFYGCNSLSFVTIGNSVTSIGDWAFNSCKSLSSITIPNNITSIGDEAFAHCSALTTITCLPNTPPTVSNIGANTTSCKLLVPQSAYKDYFLHEYWGQFLDLVYGYEVTLQTNHDQWGEVTGDGLYSLDSIATIAATPNEGYTFLRWSDGNTDNPRTIQVTSDTTLTAEFAIEGGCLVTFVDWDGTVISSVSVVPGCAATTPANPTRKGYTFIGWDKDFSNVTNHMTVTAQYHINRYRVRFFDEDTLLKTDSVEYQSAAVAPANPYHEGYTFIGWDKEIGSITADLDVYAVYEIGENREVLVIYTNSEDGDSEISNHSVTLKVPAAPTIEGFTFLGWKPIDAFISDVLFIQAVYQADMPTSAPEVYVNPANPAQKLLRNGQVYILQDGKTYTTMGAEIQ